MKAGGAPPPPYYMVSSELIPGLQSVLPAYISARRWFRAKTKSISQVEVEDAIQVAPPIRLLVLRLAYTEGPPDRYLLPVAVYPAERPGELIARLDSLFIYSALEDSHFRARLLAAIASNETLPGTHGDLVASCTELFDPSITNLESVVSRAEQSNTSIIYADRCILKLFRKIEPGINPDIEIGRFLTARRFRHTPAVLGSLEYRQRSGAQVFAAGLLQQFVRNRGDAWAYTLDSLTGFFARALPGDALPPELPIQHPLALAQYDPPEEIVELLGPYFESARLLGQRTAEMHTALADPAAGPGFAPEPFTSADAQQLHREMMDQANGAFEVLSLKAATLDESSAAAAQELLALDNEITARFAALRDSLSSGVPRIRQHGDYHLGQVLYTGSDFMIIDFEGEPARPLAERRAKGLAMRDVAGMLRSFQYAAYAALPLASAEPAEAWAAFWNSWISAAFLQAYFWRARGLSYVPAELPQQKLLLDAFLLQKALYEVAYELNNRPDWVRIPLRGILGLLG